MVFQIIWSDRAKREIGQIVDFIRLDNPAAAERLLYDLIRRVEQLSQSPRAAAVYRRRRGFESRQFSFRGYRIFYRVRPRIQRLEVLAIWHGARQEPKLP